MGYSATGTDTLSALVRFISTVILENVMETILSLGYGEVKGVQYGYFNTMEKLIDLEEGQEVELVKEPTNRYDPHAIKILVKGKILGYIPKTNTWMFHSLLAQQNLCKLKITISSIVPESFQVILKCELIVLAI